MLLHNATQSILLPLLCKTLVLILCCLCKLLPIYIFASLVTQFWVSGMDMILRLWKPILVCTGICAFFCAAKAVLVGLHFKVHPGRLLRVNLSAMLVGFTTASSVSAFSLSSDICENKLGVSPALTRTELSIGGILYNAGYSALYVIIAFYAAECYGVAVNFVWLFLLWLLCSILCPATPPISGGTLVCLGIMLTQLHIPMEALAISSTLSVLLDFICTGFRVSSLNLEVALQADKLGMLDRTVLQKNCL